MELGGQNVRLKQRTRAELGGEGGQSACRALGMKFRVAGPESATPMESQSPRASCLGSDNPPLLARVLILPLLNERSLF